MQADEALLIGTTEFAVRHYAYQRQRSMAWGGHVHTRVDTICGGRGVIAVGVRAECMVVVGRGDRCRVRVHVGVRVRSGPAWLATDGPALAWSPRGLVQWPTRIVAQRCRSCRVWIGACVPWYSLNPLPNGVAYK